MGDDIFEQLMKTNFKTLTEENTEANTKISSENIQTKYKWSDICTNELSDKCNILFIRSILCLLITLIIIGVAILVITLTKNT